MMTDSLRQSTEEYEITFDLEKFSNFQYGTQTFYFLNFFKGSTCFVNMLLMKILRLIFQLVI